MLLLAYLRPAVIKPRRKVRRLLAGYFPGKVIAIGRVLHYSRGELCFGVGGETE